MNKIKDLIREIKFGFQRMFRGYDDTAYWGLDTYLAEMLVPIMTWYRDNDPHMMLKNAEKEDYYTEEEQTEIYNKMIFAFKAVNRNNYNLEETDLDKIEEGLHLFAEHYRGFWT